MDRNVVLRGLMWAAVFTAAFGFVMLSWPGVAQ